MGLVEGPDGNFYGTTDDGGPFLCGSVEGPGNDFQLGPPACGVVFRITPSGEEAVLYFFSGGSDGGTPSPQLIVGPDGALYGTTPTFNEALGEYGGGTVFRIDLTGVETVLYSFPYAGNATTDPSTPIGIILASDGNFYGTSGYGGANHAGTLFRVTMSGAETVVYSFAGGSDGQIPSGAPTEGSDGNFYGTTQFGGTTNLDPAIFSAEKRVAD